MAQVKSQRVCVRSSLDSLDTKVSDMSVNGNCSLLFQNFVILSKNFRCLCFLAFWVFSILLFGEKFLVLIDGFS
jgi:hypothetical protein